MQQQQQRTSGLINFTDFFREEKDVWVKSVVPGQVTVEFELSPGNSVGICVPYTGDPICLTDRIPFEAIKRSWQLRTLCGPRRVRDGEIKPPALMLLTAEQAREHFAVKAQRRGLWVRDEEGQLIKDEAGKPIPDVEAAAQTATTALEQPRVVVRPPDADDDDGDQSPSRLQVRYSEVVQPRVLHLVHQVDDSFPANERMTADVLLTELEAIEPILTKPDLEHIKVKGFYKTIKTWAEERLDLLQQENNT